MTLRFPSFAILVVSWCHPGCVGPSSDRVEVVRGQPIVQSEEETVLTAGTSKEDIIQRFGRASWTAFNDRMLAYEGEVYSGKVFDSGNLVLGIVGGVLSQGHASELPQVVYRLKDYSRILLLFDEADKLKTIDAKGGITEPMISRVIQVLDFCASLDMDPSMISADSLASNFQSELSWSASSGRLQFYGFIREEVGDVNGVYVAFDEQGNFLQHRRHRFGRFAKHSEFLRNLDDYMFREWMKVSP